MLRIGSPHEFSKPLMPSSAFPIAGGSVRTEWRGSLC